MQLSVVPGVQVCAKNVRSLGRTSPKRFKLESTLLPSSLAQIYPIILHRMSLQNPLNVILLPPILYLLSLIFYPPLKPAKDLPREYDPNIYNWLPLNHPDVLLYKCYSPKQLVIHDGKDGGRILLAIMNVASGKGERTVFDVTSGRSFYGPGAWFLMVFVWEVELMRGVVRWCIWKLCGEGRI
jgi:hypothetical protein